MVSDAIKKYFTLGSVWMLIGSAFLVGVASQIVPLEYAKKVAPELTCEWVKYLVRNVKNTGWNCVAQQGLSFSRAGLTLISVASFVALLAFIVNFQSRFGRIEAFLGMFTWLLLGWITAASGFTLAFRLVNFLLGRLYPSALLIPFFWFLPA